jgi:hypothetical protein
MAEFKFLGYLTEVAGAQTKSIVLERPTRLRDILNTDFPEKNVIILIDGEAGHLDSLIENESSVVIMPMLSGG